MVTLFYNIILIQDSEIHSLYGILHDIFAQLKYFFDLLGEACLLRVVFPRVLWRGRGMRSDKGPFLGKREVIFFLEGLCQLLATHVS